MRQRPERLTPAGGRWYVPFVTPAAPISAAEASIAELQGSNCPFRSHAVSRCALSSTAICRRHEARMVMGSMTRGRRRAEFRLSEATVPHG